MSQGVERLRNKQSVYVLFHVANLNRKLFTLGTMSLVHGTCQLLLGHLVWTKIKLSLKWYALGTQLEDWG